MKVRANVETEVFVSEGWDFAEEVEKYIAAEVRKQVEGHIRSCVAGALRRYLAENNEDLDRAVLYAHDKAARIILARVNRAIAEAEE